MNIFFTADSHFHHAKIIQYCPDSRGHFTNVEEMNEFLIQQWNQTVSSTDLVYHLGDVAFANAEVASQTLKRLNGKIILIPGNHDYKLLKNAEFVACFTEIKPASYYELKVNKQFTVLSHYPIARWNRMYYNQFHLHGHCHGSYVYHQNAIDVGVDARPSNDLNLWEYNEIIEYLSNRPALIVKNVGIDNMINKG